MPARLICLLLIEEYARQPDRAAYLEFLRLMASGRFGWTSNRYRGTLGYRMAVRQIEAR